MKSLLAALALAAGGVAVPAAAGDTDEIEVKYADLDLSSERGRAALERRIDQAALRKCGRGVSTGPVLSSGRAKACYERARASARQRIAEATGGANATARNSAP